MKVNPVEGEARVLEDHAVLVRQFPDANPPVVVGHVPRLRSPVAQVDDAGVAHELEPAVVPLRRRLGNVLDRQRGPRGSGAALHDLEDLAEVRAAVGDRVDDHGVGVRLAAVAVHLHGEDDEEQDQERDVDVGGPVAEIEQCAPDATAGRAAELLGLPGHEGRHGRRNIPRQVTPRRGPSWRAASRPRPSPSSGPTAVWMVGSTRRGRGASGTACGPRSSRAAPVR